MRGYGIRRGTAGKGAIVALCAIILLSIPSCGGGSGSDNGAAAASPSSDPVDPPVAASGEGGMLYRPDGAGLNVVVLWGSWPEMGRQYGTLLKDEMEAFYDAFMEQLPPSPDDVEVMYESLDQAHKEFIAGMAETTGFTLDKQKTIALYVPAAFVRLLYGCSQMAAWGAYTKDGRLIQGRNFDLYDPFPSYKKFVTVTVYNPTDSPNAFADVSFVGAPGVNTAMNSRGVYAATNAGMISDPNLMPDQRMLPVLLQEVLLDSTDISGFDTLLDPANAASWGQIVNVSDPSAAAVYECATTGTRKRTGDGLVASTNHFTDPGWVGLPEITPGIDFLSSELRLSSLLSLAETYKGTIDEQRMRDIFDLWILAGGPTVSPYTIYQVVATPGARKMWVKAPLYSEWQEIDLGALFQK